MGFPRVRLPLCSREDWREEPAWAGLGVGWGQASVWGNGGLHLQRNELWRSSFQSEHPGRQRGQTDLGKKASPTGQASACVCVHDINIIIRIL